MKFPGRKLSPEQKEHLRQIKTGKKLSPEHAKKVTENLRANWDKTRRPVGSIVQWGPYEQIKVNSGKWEYVHRHVASEKIGRPLTTADQVHHINFNPLDNRPENLVVISKAEHLQLHSQIEYLMKELCAKGIVVYIDGKYVQRV